MHMSMVSLCVYYDLYEQDGHDILMMLPSFEACVISLG